MKSLIRKVREKVAYERESARMGREHLARVRSDLPELYVKGYWRKTAEQARREVGK